MLGFVSQRSDLIAGIYDPHLVSSILSVGGEFNHVQKNDSF